MYIQNATTSVSKSGWAGVEGVNPSPPAASSTEAQSATAVTQKSVEPTPAQLQGAVDKINSSMKEINSNLQFSIDNDTKRVVVKVVESKTGEVIKQFPSEEALSIAKAIDRFQQGLLVKQSA
ncbi:Flagellar protein [Ferriphaselus amnicola]|uniref:Flagellar protein n=1 Tax=Ferriphaselus amnicola TaxID=1188319 RepID=A0A2Z6G8Y9_9PROT|nr:flagellar protein FlaG [Ferriphaselus amnicola]BBE49942.1 Flagellar protein [Ferriphaselus amnicola]